MKDADANEHTENMIKRFNISTPSANQAVYYLSGGNQQKVLLGIWMGIDPKVLIVDEPTRGVDVGAKKEIYGHIFDLAEKGAAIMLISSDLIEILGMSDRICVMCGGRLQRTLDASDANEELILSCALSGGEISV